MLLLPDPTSAFLDPFTADKTMAIICDVYDPMKKAAYSKDPRGVAKKAEAYLQIRPASPTPVTGGRRSSSSSSTKSTSALIRINFGYQVESIEAHWLPIVAMACGSARKKGISPARRWINSRICAAPW